MESLTDQKPSTLITHGNNNVLNLVLEEHLRMLIMKSCGLF